MITDNRALRYVPDETIYYKLNFDDDWKELLQRTRIIVDIIEWLAMYMRKGK